MIIPLDPSLEGFAEKRFFSIARQIRARQSDGDSAQIGTIVEAESRDANLRPELNGQAER
ncbi:MAG TPA: hypothetical protein VFY87_24695 [Geminicoccaceae bacterium]|nr:hypothetical protein [Geminicoccaceae bacterium]